MITAHRLQASQVIGRYRARSKRPATGLATGDRVEQASFGTYRGLWRIEKDRGGAVGAEMLWKVGQLSLVPEGARRDQQVLQRTADADVQLALRRIGDLQPACAVAEYQDAFRGHGEAPRLGIVRRRGKNGVPEQEQQPVARVPVDRELPGRQRPGGISLRLLAHDLCSRGWLGLSPFRRASLRQHPAVGKVPYATQGQSH